MTVAHEPLVAMPVPTARTVREIRHLSVVRSEPRFVQGTLALSYSMPSGVAAVPRVNVDDDDPLGTEPVEIPNPHRWAGPFVQAVVEVIAQQRPVSQLARWTAPDVYAELSRLQRAGGHRRVPGVRVARAAVASVRVFQLAADAVEVSARVAEGPRSRAVAGRLDFRRGRWTCTALTLG